MIINNKKKGFVVLLGVLLLTAVLAILLPTLILISTDNYRLSDSINKGVTARIQAESCVEIALEKLRLNNTYNGNETITLIGSATCYIRPLTGSGQNRLIETQSTVDNHTKKIRVTLSQLTPQIITSSWIEVSDF